MTLITKRSVKIHARGTVSTIDAGKPLPAGTPDRVIEILRAQDALVDVPSTPAAVPPVAQDAADVDDGKSTATPAKR
ncbi:hypothetical protein [Burkholderia arboris]|uniref:hypothetical protein n=1 Tax=Burkholderia arboris TaxID=488730 RepID=UPI00158D995C|nr:hypothetical protein [Burkholderia arboris]